VETAQTDQTISNRRENPVTAQSLESSRCTGVGNRLGVLLLSLVLGVLVVAVLLSILNTVVTASGHEERHIPVNPEGATSISLAPSITTTVYITKTVDPTQTYPGEMVSICFTIMRPGLDVVLVQDVSWSMTRPVSPGGGITQAMRLTSSKEAAIVFVRELQSTDRGAVVPYSITAHLALPLTANKDDITKTITRLQSLDDEWYTNIGEGIRVAHGELTTTSPHYMSETIKAIIFLSDGRANHPIDEDTAKTYARQQAEAAAEDNIRIYTIGFGYDADEDLLQYIADTSGGEYFFAPTSSVLESVYLTIAVKLRNLVMTDILIPSIDANCPPQGIPYSCSGHSDGGITVTWPVNDNLLMSNPLTLCFTAIVSLPPSYEGLINGPDSGFCYQDLVGQANCGEFNNPTIVVVFRTLYLPVVLRDYPPPVVCNGGFERGWACWTHGGELPQVITSTNPHSGSFSALLGDPAYQCGSGVPLGGAWMEQTVLVPSAKTSPTLSFWYNIFTHDKNYDLSDPYDSFDVRINGVRVFRDMNTTNPYKCDNLRNLGWRQKTINLSSYVGTYITIRFENWNRFDKWYNTWTYVDDVQIDP